MHAALDSALLRSWASGIVEVDVDEDCFSRPDMSRFFAGAAKLQVVRLWCYSVISAAQAERALSGCPQVTDLEAHGTQILNKFPTNLRRLSMEFQEQYEEQMLDPLLPSALLYKVASLSQLQELRLVIMADQVQLDCPLQCPGLQKVDLSFSLYDETAAHLGWLRAQPASTSLVIRIIVWTAEPKVHSELTEQLQQLPVTELSLCFLVPFPLAVQEMWHKVAVSSHCRLCFENVSPAQASVQLLPSSPEFLIDLVQIRPISGNPATLAGAALTSQAANSISLWPGERASPFWGAATSPWIWNIGPGR